MGAALSLVPPWLGESGQASTGPGPCASSRPWGPGASPLHARGPSWGRCVFLGFQTLPREAGGQHTAGQVHVGVLPCVHACFCAPVCWCACVTPAVSQGPLPPAWNPDSTVLPALSCWVVDALGRHLPPTPAQDQEGGPACVRLIVTGWERTRRVAQRVCGSVLPAGRGPGGWPSVWAAQCYRLGGDQEGGPACGRLCYRLGEGLSPEKPPVSCGLLRPADSPR